PVRVGGVVQSRPLVTALANRTGNFILTGDQSGGTYAIDAQTGAFAWSGPSLGAPIQAQATVQLGPFADPVFEPESPNQDLVFSATRAESPTDNRVVALFSGDGTPAFVYAPGDLDIVSGSLAVDYVNNRLWIASRAGTQGAQTSLRVISTVSPPVP